MRFEAYSDGVCFTVKVSKFSQQKTLYTQFSSWRKSNLNKGKDLILGLNSLSWAYMYLIDDVDAAVNLQGSVSLLNVPKLFGVTGCYESIVLFNLCEWFGSTMQHEHLLLISNLVISHCRVPVSVDIV
jgi:hypothetical protein